MKTALTFAGMALIALSAVAQEAPRPAPQDTRSDRPAQIEIPEGAFEIALPTGIHIDKGGVVRDGNRTFAVGSRRQPATHRVLQVPKDDTAAVIYIKGAPHWISHRTPMSTLRVLAVPKGDSIATVGNGAVRLYVSERGHGSTLRVREVPQGDAAAIVNNGKFHLWVGYRSQGSVQRMLDIPKEDSAAIVDNGKVRLWVGHHHQLSTLRLAPEVGLDLTAEDALAEPAVGDVLVLLIAAEDEGNEAVPEPVISRTIESAQPDVPARIDAAAAGREAFGVTTVAPNPITDRATISYRVPAQGHTTLTVFDASGRPVRTLVDDDITPGSHTATFEASDLAPGRYFCRLTSGLHASTTPLTVVR